MKRSAHSFKDRFSDEEIKELREIKKAIVKDIVDTIEKSFNEFKIPDSVQFLNILFANFFITGGCFSNYLNNNQENGDIDLFPRNKELANKFNELYYDSVLYRYKKFNNYVTNQGKGMCYEINPLNHIPVNIISVEKFITNPVFSQFPYCHSTILLDPGRKTITKKMLKDTDVLASTFKLKISKQQYMCAKHRILHKNPFKSGLFVNPHQGYNERLLLKGFRFSRELIEEGYKND